MISAIRSNFGTFEGCRFLALSQATCGYKFARYSKSNKMRVHADQDAQSG